MRNETPSRKGRNPPIIDQPCTVTRRYEDGRAPEGRAWPTAQKLSILARMGWSVAPYPGYRLIYGWDKIPFDVVHRKSDRELV